MQKRYYPLIFFLLVCSIFCVLLRFYNLNWGAPFYFHPDERNIASSVTSLKPNDLNPHFFAYGSLPLYTIYGTGILSNILFHTHPVFSVSFPQAIIISRFYSSLFSCLLPLFLFFAGRKLKNTRVGILACLFGVFSVGFIQFAHFGTFEMWLTFFSLLFFIHLLSLLQNPSILSRLLLGLLFGILMAIKISSIVFLPLVFLGIFLSYKHKSVFPIVPFLSTSIASVIISIAVYILCCPFSLIDSSSFWSSILYEVHVANGTLPVFYTGSFIGTIPILFHFRYIFPFLLNPFMTLVFLFSFIFFIRNYTEKKYVLLVCFFFILFLPQAFLFVKWTRYMVPVLPFMYLMISLFLDSLHKSVIKRFLFPLLLSSSMLFAVCFVHTAYSLPHTTIQAAAWAQKHLHSSQAVLSEVYDLGIVPFNPLFSSITLFHFYDLDNNSPTSTPASLTHLLATNTIIILPSQRLLHSRLLHQKQFPQAFSFYTMLLQKHLSFIPVYTTPCDIWCRIVYMGDPVFSLEETATVFDRPSVAIFEKKNL